MQLETIHRNYEPTKRVQAHVEERADKFEKYIHDLQRVRFTLLVERLDQVCEIHLHYRGRDFHSKADSEDMLTSVDKASASMEKQLRRFKTKVTDHNSRFSTPGITSAAALEASIDREGGDEED